MKKTGKLTIYEKSTCAKCRQTLKILNDAKVNFDIVEYYKTPISSQKIKTLLKKLNMSVTEILRKGEDVGKKLNVYKGDYSDNELIDLVAKNPSLMQRPIIESGGEAVLGRPPENVKKLL